MILLNSLKKIVPSRIRCFIRQLFVASQERILINIVKGKQEYSLSKLRDKQKIRCVFFALFEEIWKVDNVYRLMTKNPRFEPIILVCPIVNYGHDNMVKRMNDCYNHFKSKEYNVIKAYDELHNKYVDVREFLNPDIIVYTNPYEGLIDDRYYIKNYMDILTIYTPYYFCEWNKYGYTYDLLFHNVLWRYYLEVPVMGKLSKKYSRCKGRNTVVVGYPGIEKLIAKDYMPSSKVWKEDNPQKKRIIWAPHHTIEETEVCNYSCFLKYSEFMIDLAKKYQEEVQFAFKPHPLLKNKLEKLWGKDKTDAYYSCWDEMTNTCLSEGEYIDLFRTSDAMIHDSGSFIAEYLYVNKPVMRTLNGTPLTDEFNPFALKCLDNYYLAETAADIETFVRNVISGIDAMKNQRTKFIEEEMMPKGIPSENIVNDILDSIDNQILYR